MAYKVIQWTTGHIARAAVAGILNHPDLELVGCYAYSKEKDGKDVGELCGIDPIGVTATSDIDKLLALEADCVSYMPAYHNIDEMVRILSSGKNLVSSYFGTGSSLSETDRSRLVEAAKKGGSSLFGSGIFPGFANFIAGLTAAATHNFKQIRFQESVDLTHYEAFYSFANLGWGLPPEDRWAEVTEDVLGPYSECIDIIADMLKIPITDKKFQYEAALATEDRTFSGYPVPKGTIAGTRCVWSGLVGDETVVELTVVWKAGETVEPNWPIKHGYLMEVIGSPIIRTRLSAVPASVEEANADMTNPCTAMPVVNAIPAVCEAEPGIRTYADLPLITGRYVGSMALR